jgi:hypothetical protein
MAMKKALEARRLMVGLHSVNEQACDFFLGVKKIYATPLLADESYISGTGEEKGGGSIGAIKSGWLIGAIFSRPVFYNSNFVPQLN